MQCSERGLAPASLTFIDRHRAMTPSTKDRWLLFLAAWILALCFAATSPSAIVYLPMFPAGLLLAYTKTGGGNEGSWIALGWLLYVIQAAYLFGTSHRTRFYIVYAILIGMLATNVAGCHKIVHEMSGLH